MTEKEIKEVIAAKGRLEAARTKFEDEMRMIFRENEDIVANAVRVLTGSVKINSGFSATVENCIMSFLGGLCVPVEPAITFALLNCANAIQNQMDDGGKEILELLQKSVQVISYKQGVGKNESH